MHVYNLNIVLLEVNLFLTNNDQIKYSIWKSQVFLFGCFKMRFMYFNLVFSFRFVRPTYLRPSLRQSLRPYNITDLSTGFILSSALPRKFFSFVLDENKICTFECFSKFCILLNQFPSGIDFQMLLSS